MARVHNKTYSGTTAVLFVLFLITALISMRWGAVNISTQEILSAFRKWFASSNDMTLNESIFWDIRLPRAILCLVVGGALAVGGVLMQALFRNPIVEPGLIGTSSGAAFGAAVYFVLGGMLKFNTGEWTLPLAAFAGGVLSTSMAFGFSRSRTTGKSSVVSLLLTGIAVNALFLSGVGFMTYTARDPQARSITYWSLGTLSGSNWHGVIIIGATTLLCILIAMRYGKHLNALMLGEDEARFLGVNIKRLKLSVLFINVAMIAIATAFVGIISFVGLVVPHLLRIVNGSDNRSLIRNSALLGGILLSLADLLARLVMPPSELPIGILMATVGVPVFLILLRRKNYLF
jgi:iron complex transport system permease protein